MAKDLNFNLSIETVSTSATQGEFQIKPLQRGYGITLGNALRRVAMTSIPGAAITNVKIEGVQHEFGTIPGVRDDVSDIIMNLKGVRFKLNDSNPDRVLLKLEGKKTFTAADIQKGSAQFDVLNPDHYITEINEGTVLEIELRVGIGRGYVPSEENEIPNSPIGMIAIDSIFNPVTNVSFSVHSLPGEKESSESLSLVVHTDGSITPQDAISYSASVLIAHFRVVEGLSKPEVLEVSDNVSEETLAIRKLLQSTIEEMELSVRSFNCLQAAGIRFIYELVSKEESAMLKYKNFGRKSLTELIEKLDEMGLQFGMNVEKYLTEEV